MVNFVSESRLPFCTYISVLFTKKPPRRPETGIKDGFKEIEHEFPFGTFRPEKQNYLSAPGNFPVERPK